MTDIDAIRARDREVDESPLWAAWDAHPQIKQLVLDRRALLAELDESRASFDLRWKADMRAIKRWQEAHPEAADIWPDHVDLVLWLMGERDALDSGVFK